MIEIKTKKRGKGKLMKTKKIIVLLTAISFLTSAPFAVQAKNCSGFKMLSHKWIMCQTGSNKYEADMEALAQAMEEEGESFNEKYGSIADFFKKRK